jgi:predicted DNA-binding protein with PD1-like motif
LRTLATGRLGRVIYAHLDPGDDIYRAILEIARDEGIRAGVILDITGGASHLRMVLPRSATSADRPPEVIEVPGLAEVMGSGIIGHVENDFVSHTGDVTYTKGDPYLHVHLSATSNGLTYTGHLTEGTLVRSVISRSHFTIVIAEVEGVELSLLVDNTCSDSYPSGVPYHELRQLTTPEQI